MTARAGRWLAAVFFVAYLVALVWPGVLPFNHVHPMVLGMPFNLFWVAAWVVVSLLVFALLERSRDDHNGED